MSYRNRLFVAFALAVLVPLGLLAYGVRRELDRRLSGEYRSRLAAAAGDLHAQLDRESGSIAARLAALAADLGRDNRFRLAVVQRDPAARRELLDYAGEAMRTAGLDFLEVQDCAGRILSSGHFRNDFDRLEPELPSGLIAAGARPALIRARTATGPLLAFARIDSVLVAGQRFTVAGGLLAKRVLGLRSGPDLTVTLSYPDSSLAPSASSALAAPLGTVAAGDLVDRISLPYTDLMPGASSRPDSARLIIRQSSGTLAALRRSLDLWLLAAVGATTALALALAAWLSARISRPLRELADKTAAIDLERLDQDFGSARRDEIGALSRLLGAMVERLREGAARIREAERRVAMADLARQVNHDVKNGLVPIRHVLRHLEQVAQLEPERLAAVFGERKGTLESSVGYLETLARNYAKLAPGITREPCDLNAVAAEVARGAAAFARSPVQLRLTEGLPAVWGDRLVLRRVLENLVGNALASLSPGTEGAVTITTELIAEGQEPAVRVTVADTGRGMTGEELERAFDGFYTTKEGGTGLGLSIVRRLILDLEGRLRVETEPGAGTRVIIELPAASPARPIVAAPPSSAPVPPEPPRSAPLSRSGRPGESFPPAEPLPSSSAPFPPTGGSAR